VSIETCAGSGTTIVALAILWGSDMPSLHFVGLRHALVDPGLEHVDPFVREECHAAIVGQVQELDVLPASGLVEQLEFSPHGKRRGRREAHFARLRSGLLDVRWYLRGGLAHPPQKPIQNTSIEPIEVSRPIKSTPRG